MYQTDVLEILDILTELGIKERQTYNSDRLLIPIGQKDEQSKWITLRAMKVLKRFKCRQDDCPKIKVP